MLIVTDAGTGATVLLGVIVLVGILGAAMAVFGVLKNRAEQKLESARSEFRQSISALLGSSIDLVYEDPGTFSTMELQQFYELNRPLLEGCLTYGENVGLEFDASVKDAIQFCTPLFEAYADARSDPLRREEFIEAAKNFVGATIRLEELGEQEQRQLAGGLSTS